MRKIFYISFLLIFISCSKKPDSSVVRRDITDLVRPEISEESEFFYINSFKEDDSNNEIALLLNDFYSLQEQTHYVDLEKLSRDENIVYPLKSSIYNPDGSEFTYSQIFEILSELKIIDDYSFKYIHLSFAMGSFPITVVREDNDSEFSINSFEFNDDFNRNKFLDYIIINDTEMGYFQYYLLKEYSNRFLLGWHALYDQAKIVTSYNDMESKLKYFIQFTEKDTEFLKYSRYIDYSPQIILNEDYAYIRTIVLAHNGLYEEIVHINRDLNHHYRVVSHELINEFQSKIQF